MRIDQYVRKAFGWFKKLWTSGFGAEAGERSQLNTQVVGLVVALALTTAVVMGLVLWVWEQGYEPLYGEREQYDVAKVTELLDRGGIGYKILPHTGQVLVRSGDLSKAKMAMAAGGVTAPVAPGKKRFDQKQALGTSHYMEEKRYLVALEEELSKTILGISAVKRARVHLAMPTQTAFLRNMPEVSASVYVELYSGSELETAQVRGVVRMVAGSVPGLEEKNVSVVDQHGNVLNMFAEDSQASEVNQYLQARRSIESYLETQISNILVSVVGRNHFRIDVSVDLNMDQYEETLESYGPESLVRSESIEAGGPQARTGGTQASSQRATGDQDSDKVVRNYEVSRQVSQQVRQPGRVDKLSIAVLLNESQLAVDEEELGPLLDRLTELLKRACGFNESRGDEIDIVAYPFVSQDEQNGESLYARDVVEQYSQWFYAAFLVVVALMLLVVFWRSVSGKNSKLTAAGIGAEGLGMAAGAAGAAAALSPTGASSADSSGGEEGEGGFSEKVIQVSIDDYLQNIKTQTENNPEKAAEVLKQWIARK